MKLNGAELITRYLEACGTTHIAGVHPSSRSDALLPLLQALTRSRLVHVRARDTQSAGLIAQGIACTTARAGVCLATAGADMTGLLTAIADARASAVPLVVLCARAPCANGGSGWDMRVGYLVDPIAKTHLEVRAIEDLFDLLPEAFRIAQSEAPGPVVLEVPAEALTARIEWARLPVRQADEACLEGLPGFAFQPSTYRGADHATTP